MLLNLDGFTATETHIANNVLCITIESSFEPTNCLKCSSLFASFYSHGTNKQFFHDAPVHGKPTLLKIYRKRFKCRECGGTFDEPLDIMHPDHNITKRLVTLITRECNEERFTDVARRNGLTEKTVRNIYRAYADALRQSYKFETPECLGIDEINIRRMRAVITNLKEKTLIDMLPGRKKEDVLPFLLSLDRSKVKLISMDMWQAYRDACAIAFPSAIVVVDRFHVQKTANEIMTKIRVAAVKELESKDQRKLVKKGKYLLLSRNFNLNECQQDSLLELIELCPILGHALVAKERFMDIWTIKDRATAEKAYADWEAALSAELKPHFKELTTHFKNWHTEIFNWWDHGITNAYTERLNGTIRELHTAGKGYSFEVLRVRIISKITIHKRKAIPEKIDKNAFAKMVMGYSAPQRLNYGVDISTLIGLKDLKPDSPLSTLLSE